MSPERLQQKVLDLENEVVQIRKDLLALAKRMAMVFHTSK